METKSGTGKVNVGEATYELIKDDFECEFRGHIPAKNKGKLRMYYVHGLKKKSKKSKEAKPAMA
jgi:class 3 adenylate cyclase